MANDIAYANLNTLAASIGPKYLEGKMEEIVFHENLLLDKIKASKNIKINKGTGKSLVQNIRIGRNSTVGNRPTRDTIPVANQETTTTAEWPWGSITGSISFDDDDLHDNMGKAELISILQPALDQVMDTVAERLQLNLVAETSADSLSQFLGLKDVVTDGTWTHPATYGGLTTAAYPLWSSWVTNNGGDLGDLVLDLNHTFNSAANGTNQPDMIYTTQTGEELYRNQMDPSIRYTDFKIGDATISAVTFRGRPVLLDKDMTGIATTPSGVAGTMTWSGTTDTASTERFYLLNSKYWELHFDSKWNLENMIEDGWRIPVNEFRRVKPVAIRGQVVCKQRRYQGVVVNVAA